MDFALGLLIFGWVFILIWVPLVAGWNLFPYLALKQAHPLFAVPDFAHAIGFYAALRWIAAVCAVLLLGLTVDCWLRMGKNWRMGVSLDQTTQLVTTGLFRHIRHPIYALSIVLMLCSLIIIPTLPMLVIAVLHVTLMIIKARNEEHHLRRTRQPGGSSLASPRVGRDVSSATGSDIIRDALRDCAAGGGRDGAPGHGRGRAKRRCGCLER